MRIHKIVERVLKFSPADIDFDLHLLWGNDHSEATEWLTEVIQRAIEEPSVDLIASRYGMTAEELLDGLDWRVTMVDTQAEYGPAGPRDPYAMASYTPGRERVNLLVGMDTVKDRQDGEVMDLIFHELDHAARDKASGAKGVPYDSFLEWLAIPQERDAVKSEIEHLFNTGYSEEQILSMLWTNWGLAGAVLDPGFDETAAIEAVEQLIEEVIGEGERLVEWEGAPGG